VRIAQISTLASPVRRDGSESVEGVVWALTRELIRLGHEVTVFAAGGSESNGEVVATLPGPYAASGSPWDWQLCEWINLCRAIEQSHRFDVLHSHAYLWGLPLEPLARAPMVHTMHVLPGEDQARLWSMAPDACVTAISKYQWSGFSQLKAAAVIYDGVDASLFMFQPKPEDYVCFLGRFIPGKGPVRAIEAAREIGVRLLLAGPRNEYYRAAVEQFVDGRWVEYVGSVSGKERDGLLGGARALLYPVEAPEPFGLVQVEAMMCGTPVAALGLGAVPEVVDPGVTGFYAKDLEGLIAVVPKVFELDRGSVRKQAALRFSSARMAANYAEVYARLAASRHLSSAPTPVTSRLHEIPTAAPATTADR
jgi:glycosyltransferase involved in cell wall biosynthesis